MVVRRFVGAPLVCCFFRHRGRQE